ncbi:MAG: ABC transporter ATP-binding protein [Kiritimatiellia bacterium]
MSPVVEVRNLEKVYETPGGAVRVLDSINWQLETGGFCAITGPSGCGKTTLLNLVSLLDIPTSGEILMEGESVANHAESMRIDLRKSKIGMIFQKFNLLPQRSALENVLFRARYLGAKKISGELRERAHVIMEQLGLTALRDRPARLLSGGEMQRVAIARALLVPPVLLVADEPTGNLDQAAASQVMEALAEVNRRGIAVLLVTHNHALLRYASSHYAFREGRLCREQ